jgi:hypothetical protein
VTDWHPMDLHIWMLLLANCMNLVVLVVHHVSHTECSSSNGVSNNYAYRSDKIASRRGLSTSTSTGVTRFFSRILRSLMHASCALLGCRILLIHFILFSLHAGLIRHLRFTSSANHLELLLRLVEASPLIATAVLSSCALSPDPRDSQASCINAKVASRCMNAAAALRSEPRLQTGSSLVVEPPVSSFLLKSLPQNLSQVRVCACEWILMSLTLI